MEAFVKTSHCTSGIHCRTCRDRQLGRRWREIIAGVFEVPMIDWLCPKGKPWGWTPPSRGLGDTVAKFIKRATRGRLKPCSGCKKRQKALNRRWPYKQGA